ncbi:MAG: VOC family protein [Lachnospiraceae bacterium]|nr:VOC family protein [Lachnospiraceae bacterium]
MKLLHVTIKTDKFEEELRFYKEVAGLQITRDMRPLGRNMVFLANAEGESEIEIIETPGAENAGNENLSIGFLTMDVTAKREELIAVGMEVTPMIRPNPQVQFFFVKNPAGVNVQFM